MSVIDSAEIIVPRGLEFGESLTPEQVGRIYYENLIRYGSRTQDSFSMEVKYASGYDMALYGQFVEDLFETFPDAHSTSLPSDNPTENRYYIELDSDVGLLEVITQDEYGDSAFVEYVGTRRVELSQSDQDVIRASRMSSPSAEA